MQKKQGKDIEVLMAVIDKLAKGEKLPEKYRDHILKNMGGEIRDCHIESDWVLLYEYIDDVLVLLLHRIGSHSQLRLQF